MFLDISTIALSIASIITAYLYVRIQILANEKVFLEFQTNGLNKPQFVRNISNKAAVNTKVYRIILDITKMSKRSKYKHANISLKYSLGTIMPNEKKNIKLLPHGNYEIFVIEYNNIIGETYQTFLKPGTGRGDHEFLYGPRKIPKCKKKLDGIFEPKDIILPRYMRNIFEFKSKTL
ncbi:hypothetical protein ABHA52_13535 [Enterococcus faecium]|nr:MULTISPECIES: hypothetical protein [Enterococcus]MCA6733683.1 hypothetical protein [Enterococcus lactis]MCA6736204.1 hypothetical protein [Enterococcus lactis]MCA6738750.1 hypothetical protein [Enterococcus lactis]MCA6754334.1 hypothetical protein [Enterococcus lactis]MCA6762498.1 hypothetical protein [Enterococcus lactis]